MLLKDLLEKIELTCADVPALNIIGPAKLSEAENQHLSFLANMKYEHELYTSKAGAVLVSKDFQPKETVTTYLVRVNNPYETIAKVLEVFNQQQKRSGVDKLALVDEKARVDVSAYIGPFSHVERDAIINQNSDIASQVYIGKGVEIGKNCAIHAGVKIYNNCIIGDDCIIHSGTIIGADGFGFAPQDDGSFSKIPQAGNVVIKNNVEIGSNCTIDRATMGSTLIGEGVKLDNLIQVGHNAVIGANTVIAAQSGVSGSTKIGEGCMIGGQVGFVGHISIAPHTKINAKSGISKSVKKEGAKINGIPAFNFTDSLRSQSIYRKLPEIQKRIQEIEEILSLHRKSTK